MGAFKQLSLLLWKNFTLQRRQILVTIVEILLPVLFSMILVLIRNDVVNTIQPNATIYNGFTLKFPHSSKYNPPLPGLWEIHYYPNTSQPVVDTMEYTASYLSVTVIGWENEQLMVEAYFNASRESNFLGAVEFQNIVPGSSALPNHTTYALRLSSTSRFVDGSFDSTGSSQRWETSNLFPFVQKPGPREMNYSSGGSPGYLRECFLAIQNALQRSIIYTKAGGVDLTKHDDIWLLRYPYPPYVNDEFIIVIQSFLPLILMLSLVFMALNIVRSIVHEKERILKESMKIMGLSNWLHWTAWFIQIFIMLLIIISIITIFLTVKIAPTGKVMSQSSPGVVFLFLLAYSIASISFCFLVSTFFSKANVAAAVGGIIWFLSYIPFSFISPRYETLSWSVKILLCLISNIGMALGSQLFGMFEGTGIGIQWYNINTPVSVDDTFTLLHVIIVLLVDAVLYGVLTWYIEVVFPGEFGVPLPFYFPFMSSYWCGERWRKYSLSDDQGLFSDELMAGGFSHGRPTADPEYFECDPTNLNVGIQIQGLSKSFSKDKFAVDGLNLNMFEGQITALLGHNGAGKTTTMSMLTGLYPPTAGRAIVNGYDIRANMPGVRRSLGLCPQHDVLFDNLTVKEHLDFFSRLKGVVSADVVDECDKMIKSLGLEDKRHCLSKNLSGGMKRKLSVGIALIGQSKIVMLDEPTSGMDPAARRSTWNLLQKHREGRTILLTTHFMDEADLLGDRIAIMADGQLRCCGSSMFLKKKYGVGYHMTFVKEPYCHVPKLESTILSHVPDGRMESNVGAELTFVLPHYSTGNFQGMFTELEVNKQALGVASFGVSVTTMEEVFLKVGEECEVSGYNRIGRSRSMDTIRRYTDDSDTPTVDNLEDDDNLANSYLISSNNKERNSGVLLSVQQFYAMFLKRVLHSYRNLPVMIAQLIIPVACTLIALIVEKTVPEPGNSPELLMDLGQYGHTWTPYSDHNSTALALSYAAQFHDTRTQLVNITETTPDSDIVSYLLHQANIDLSRFLDRTLVGATFTKSTRHSDGNLVTGLFNNQGLHTPALSLAHIGNALIQLYLGPEHGISVINHPLPATFKENTRDLLSGRSILNGFSIAVNLVFGMSFLSSSFVLFLIKERAGGSKHLQSISGVHGSNFWASTFVWDFINYMVPVAAIVFMFLAFQIDAYTTGSNIGVLLLIFLQFGMSMLPFMYLVSFLFVVPSSGFVRTTMFNIFSGLITLMAVEILAIPQLGLQYISNNLSWVFLALPNFCLAKAVTDMYRNYETITICTANVEAEFYCRYIADLNYELNYMSWTRPGVGQCLVFMAIQTVVFTGLIALIESGLIRNLLLLCTHTRKVSVDTGDIRTDRTQIDQDVVTEMYRIHNTPVDHLINHEALIVKDLRKEFFSFGKKTLVAVDDLSWGVPKAECFGLLGINGAGKTTTFKMITGDDVMSSGTALLGGYNIRTHLKSAQTQMGYCPQFDALIDQMTGKETLTMFARLRGLFERDIPTVVTQLISDLLLEEHADKLVQAYSGGNKRKLSTAIALIGEPPIIFLDEPTTGMDPVARRLLWDVVSHARSRGQSIVITSHSMEESEALCTRLAIMVNGQFKCIGSPQYLKNRFGEGYTLIAKYTPDDRDVAKFRLKHFIESRFPDATLKDEHQGVFHYNIPNLEGDLGWSNLFGVMEEAKIDNLTDDYSVSQTTLEQVFLNFAQFQREHL